MLQLTYRRNPQSELIRLHSESGSRSTRSHCRIRMSVKQQMYVLQCSQRENEAYRKFGLSVHIRVPKQRYWQQHEYTVCRESKRCMLICKEAVQSSRRAKIAQLPNYIVIEIRTTSEKAIEERR
jgi:hypothetical protein